jgi:dienelactone hydrolase
VEVAVLAALAAAVILRLGSGWRSLALLTVGVVGTAVGLGFAPAWISKAGLTVVSAAGVLALVAGLAALGFGLIDLGRSINGWLRWAAAVVVLLVSAVLFLTLALAVAVTNVPPTALGGETPADWDLAFEEAVLVADDGVALSGWYLPSANRAAVVVLHGAGSTRSPVLQHAAILARRGYGVLLFDSRGHGQSGGRAMDFGWFGDPDLAAALDYLEQRPDVDPDRIAALGLSMGGEQAIGAAAADRRLRGVVAEGATGRTADDKAWLRTAYGFSGWVQQRVDDLTYWFTDLLTSAGPPITLREAAGQMAPRPLLLITAGSVPDERLAADYIRAASPETVEVWEVPGAGHTGGLATAPVEWVRRVLAFFDNVLLGETPG